jgi:hypothetical protein
MRIDVILFPLARIPVLCPPPFAGTIDGTFAGQLQPLDSIRIDQRGRPFHFQAGDARIDPGIIIGILRTFEDRSLFDAQIDALLEEDGPSDERSFRHDNCAAALVGAAVNRFLDRNRIQCRAVSDRAKFGHNKIAGCRTQRARGRPEQRQRAKQRGVAAEVTRL